MIEKHGDMWSRLGGVDLLLVTANSYVKSNGELVMGRGAALECATKFPQTPLLFGRAITKRAARLGFYGLLIRPEIYHDQTHLGLFQVKYGWDENAQVKLIRESIFMLTNLFMSLSGWSVAMNYSGIGNGYLSKNMVDVFVKELPDNVEVWQY